VLTLVIIEGIVILLLTILVAGLLRSHAEILRTLDALGGGESPGNLPLVPVRGGKSGQPVPLAQITGTTPAGGAATVALSGQRGYVLLAFLSTGCLSCRTFWESLDRPELPSPDIRPVIVTKGSEGESPAEVGRMAPGSVTTLMSTETWDAFRVPGTPFFQLIDAARGVSVGEGSAGNWPQVVDLMRRALADSPRHRGELRRTTRQRLRDSGEELRQAGIFPGDQSLFENPLPKEGE
jgi:hypothetical protein